MKISAICPGDGNWVTETKKNMNCIKKGLKNGQKVGKKRQKMAFFCIVFILLQIPGDGK